MKAAGRIAVEFSVRAPQVPALHWAEPVHRWCSRGSHFLLELWDFWPALWWLPGLLQPPGSVCLCVCLCGSASSLCISLSMFGVLFLFFYVSDSMVMLPALMMTASGNSRQGLQCSWYTSAHLSSVKLAACITLINVLLNWSGGDVGTELSSL